MCGEGQAQVRIKKKRQSFHNSPYVAILFSTS